MDFLPSGGSATGTCPFLRCQADAAYWAQGKSRFTEYKTKDFPSPAPCPGKACRSCPFLEIYCRMNRAVCENKISRSCTQKIRLHKDISSEILRMEPHHWHRWHHWYYRGTSPTDFTWQSAPGERQTKAIAGQFLTPGTPWIGIILLKAQRIMIPQLKVNLCCPPHDQLWSSHTARPQTSAAADVFLQLQPHLLLDPFGHSTPLARQNSPQENQLSPSVNASHPPPGHWSWWSREHPPFALPQPHIFAEPSPAGKKHECFWIQKTWPPSNFFLNRVVGFFGAHDLFAQQKQRVNNGQQKTSIDSTNSSHIHLSHGPPLESSPTSKQSQCPPDHRVASADVVLIPSPFVVLQLCLNHVTDRWFAGVSTTKKVQNGSECI